MSVKQLVAKPMFFMSHHLYTKARKLDAAHQPAVPMYYMCNKVDLPWFRGQKFATVLDVGANTGGFSIELSKLFPEAVFYLFEPLPDSYAQLKERVKDRPRFHPMNLALGDQGGELEFLRSSASHSSSFLPMTSEFKSAFPHVAGSEKTKVRVDRLDDVAKTLKLEEPMFIKLDTQGYEDRVLRGGEETMRRAKLAIVETSFEPLYEGQPLFADIYQKMVSLGFRYAGAREQLCHPSDGRIMVQDAIFIKR